MGERKANALPGSYKEEQKDNKNRPIILTVKLKRENDEITIGLDGILGKLSDHLLREEPQPNLMEKMVSFFQRILGRGEVILPLRMG